MTEWVIAQLLPFFALKLDELFAFLLSVFGILLFHAFMAVLIFQAALPDVLLVVALGIGPIIVAFYPILPGLTAKLVEFTLGAMVAKAIALFVFEMATSTTNAVAQGALAAYSAGGTGFQFPLMKFQIGFILIWFFLLFFALRIAQIARGLVGGTDLGMPDLPSRIGSRP